MKSLKLIYSLLLTFIGAVSVFMTLSIIFDAFGIREKEGNYVLFIVYANLFCGIIYLISAISIWRNQQRSVYVLIVAILILLVAFLGLLIYIKNGGIYETQTVKAMVFRIVFTVSLTGLGAYILRQSNRKLL